MKISYIDKKFQKKSLETINQANQIIEEYEAEGLDLTLRQLYYQFVARDLILNKQTEYQKLGNIISQGRLAGLISWNAIVDRTRNLRSNSHWNDPGEIIKSAYWSFALDHWEGQDHRLEVWIEKEALIGVISSICQQVDVPFFACKGYVSQSELWRAARRMKNYERQGIETYILHLGDHDPSGLDMTRDIQDRFKLFGANTTIKRLALNYDQIQEYNPPPNPVKFNDSRSPEYTVEFGSSCWELDALEPRILRDLIEEEVKADRNETIYNGVLAQEKDYKEILLNVSENWKEL